MDDLNKDEKFKEKFGQPPLEFFESLEVSTLFKILELSYINLTLIDTKLHESDQIKKQILSELICGEGFPEQSLIDAAIFAQDYQT